MSDGAATVGTLARLFPGRLLPGIGHGVLDWMGQVGARAASPLTLLREYGSALRRLLDGENVTTEGRYVTLQEVQLRWPPPPVPILVGAEGPKTLALAGQIGDGLILVSSAAPERVQETIAIARSAREEAGITAPLEVVYFLSLPVTADAETIAARVEPLAAGGVTRVAVCGLSEAGPPDGSERIFDLLEAVATVSADLSR